MALIFKTGNSEDALTHFGHLLSILWPIMLAIIICAGYAALIIWLIVCLIQLLKNAEPYNMKFLEYQVYNIKLLEPRFLKKSIVFE